MLKADVARQFRAEHPDMPSLALARMMYKKNKALFTDIEDARGRLRYIEGKNGSRSRNKEVLKSEFFKAGERARNPYKLPESEETVYEPYRIKGHKRMLVISDIHIPYHSIDALTSVIKFAKNDQVDGVLINGDLIDFYGLSRFDKDPRKRSVAHELEATRTFLGILQSELKCKIYYKLGNHCERFEHYMMRKAPELLGIPEFKLEELLKLKDYNAVVIGDKRVVKMNKLNAIHGHEYFGVFSPVNIARGLYMKGKVNAIQGHNHQVSEHTEPNMDGDVTTTWSLGCLCELHPLYMPLNKWSHGFMIVDLAENGVEFHVRNKRIQKGVIL